MKLARQMITRTKAAKQARQKSWWAVATILLLTCVPALADEDVISDDGKEIRLYSDGTWTQLSRDRYATAPDGRRFKLKPDGRWEVIVDEQAGGIAQLNGDAGGTAMSKERASSGTAVLLTRVETQKVVTKMIKSNRADTRTVYYLSVRNSGEAPIDLAELPADAIQAVDSKGRQYKILSITTEEGAIQAGRSQQIIVVSDGSPRWFGVKYMSLHIAQNALGDNPRMVLSKNLHDVETRIVEAFN